MHKITSPPSNSLLPLEQPLKLIHEYTTFTGKSGERETPSPSCPSPGGSLTLIEQRTIKSPVIQLRNQNVISNLYLLLHCRRYGP